MQNIESLGPNLKRFCFYTVFELRLSFCYRILVKSMFFLAHQAITALCDEGSDSNTSHEKRVQQCREEHEECSYNDEYKTVIHSSQVKRS